MVTFSSNSQIAQAKLVPMARLEIGWATLKSKTRKACNQQSVWIPKAMRANQYQGVVSAVNA